MALGPREQLGAYQTQFCPENILVIIRQASAPGQQSRKYLCLVSVSHLSAGINKVNFEWGRKLHQCCLFPAFFSGLKRSCSAHSGCPSSHLHPHPALQTGPQPLDEEAGLALGGSLSLGPAGPSQDSDRGGEGEREVARDQEGT